MSVSLSKMNGDAGIEAVDEPRLLRDVAYERVRDAIRSGELRPGEPLSENTLSRALEISRTPVREALQQLAQEGLVQVIPGRAVTVAAPSMQEVMNVVHLRLLLEPEVARLTANHITTGALAKLLEAVETMERFAEEGDRKIWSDADTRFHEILSTSCSNELLGQFALQMRNRIHYHATDSQTSLERIKACTREHRGVADAIAAGDARAAADAMRTHLIQLRESLFNRLMHL